MGLKDADPIGDVLQFSDNLPESLLAAFSKLLARFASMRKSTRSLDQQIRVVEAEAEELVRQQISCRLK